MKRIFFAFMTLSFLISCSIPQISKKCPLDQNPLPMDSRILMGTLDNGLTYYLCKNVIQKDEAVFRLIVKVGSVQETEQQLGSAHFIEHMAFNGSAHFNKNALVEFFRSKGMGFGAGLNAHTSWEETVYKFRIPTNESTTLDQAFLVLEDWVSGLSFDPIEVEKERSVIIEEWRQSRGIYSRALQKEFYPKLFNHSRHSDRHAIGKLAVLERITAEELQRFYQDWYQPRNMAIVIVGDIDVEDMDCRVKNTFSKMTNQRHAPPLVRYKISTHKKTLYAAVADPEANESYLQIIWKNACRDLKTEQDFKNMLVEQLYISILNTRFQTIDERGSPITVDSSFKRNDQIGFLPCIELHINIKQNQYKEGLMQALFECEKAQRFGFQPSELDRAKKELLGKAIVSLKRKTTKSNEELVLDYIDKVINGNTIISEEIYLRLMKRFLPTIELQDLYNVRKRYNGCENRLIALFGTEESSEHFPSERDIENLLNEIKFAILEPYRDEFISLNFFSNQMPPGKIINEARYEEVNVTSWYLSNGLKVVLKPRLYSNNILIHAYSPGGYSVIPNEDYWSTKLAVNVLRKSGMGPYKRSDLVKNLIDKRIILDPYINFYEEGIQGGASPEELETALQLMCLGITQPIFDKEIFEEEVKLFKDSINNNKNTADWTFQEEMVRAIIPGNNGAIHPTLKDAALLNADVSKRRILERFQNSNDFTLQLVGDFEIEKIKPLILKYAATLPGGKKETIRASNIVLPSGPLRVDVNESIENKSRVEMILLHQSSYSEKKMFEFEIFEYLIDIQVDREIREKQGLIYSGHVYAEFDMGSGPFYRLMFRTECAPENTEKVVAEYTKILNHLRSVPIPEDDVEAMRKSFRDSYKNRIMENPYWAEKLKLIISQQGDPTDIIAREDWIEEITPESVQEDAMTYLQKDHLIIGILNPKNTKESS